MNKKKRQKKQTNKQTKNGGMNKRNENEMKNDVGGIDDD